VDVSVQSSGIIRPITEKVEIKSSLNEMVECIYVHEGQVIKTGDTLLTINTITIDAKITNQEELKKDREDQIADLKQFICSPEKVADYRSPKRQQEQQLFIRQLDEIRLQIENANKKLSRNKKLFESGTIPEDEYENYVLEKNKSTGELRTLIENRISLSKADQNDLQNQLNEINATLRQLKRERSNYNVLTPINGTLDQFAGIYSGSMLVNGQSIAVISPDSTLLAECYVLPKDIGFLYVNMPVNIQVESFNYNQWGMIRGKILDISSDFILSNNTAYYKVKCSLDHSYLELKSGKKGFLKKGMSILSRFMVTRRSLMQLLYQKFDDWANPAIQSISKVKTV
jgi:HlyD family secretion protein